ncbi:MAG TPA: ATP-binding protein [Solirubrobacterales bacterium]|nr:ATP-binding protein [Solirubrobacterales bacterium]
MSDIVLPSVTEDHLKLLLDQQSETETLDYKSELDLLDKTKKPRAQVELAKDIAALLSGHGGHLVIGADESGTPTGLLSVKQVAQLDESRLRKRLEKFIPDGFEIRTASHRIGGKLVALIHVSPHPDGLVVMKADGIYLEGEKERVIFREGDIFIRRGTESRRLGQAELRRHLADLRRRVEDEARAEALRSVAPLIEQSQRAEAVSAGAADRLSWDLDRRTLVSAVTEQLRRHDEVPLRLLIESAPAQASRILTPDPGEELEDLDSNQDEARAELGALVDKILALAARGLVLQNDTLLELAMEALKSIYDGVADQYGRERSDLLIAPVEIWLALIERIYALGALAVRKRRWRVVAELALQRPEVLREYRYRSWLRHAHVMAARAGLLRDPEAERAGASLLQLALAHIVATPELRPDFEPDDDRLLSSLAQFDILANLAVANVAGSVQGAGVYPHFRRFYGFRSDPAVVALLDDENARSEIYPESDTKLAQALRDLGQIGSDEFFYVSGWDGYEDERIRTFLSEHPLS